MPKLDFWFDFASTYSYLAALRVETLAALKGVEVTWRPFLLGPIFSSKGINNSPFALDPQKGQYMFRDIMRRSEKYGYNFRMPNLTAHIFPQNSVLAARIALLALSQPQGKEFCQYVFKAEFEQGLNIADTDVLQDCLRESGLPAALLEHAILPENKKALRTQVETAMSLNIFGAPTFLTKNELFWGDDRLEDALDWVLS